MGGMWWGGMLVACTGVFKEVKSLLDSRGFADGPVKGVWGERVGTGVAMGSRVLA